jgi:hypothetical protein
VICNLGSLEIYADGLEALMAILNSTGEAPSNLKVFQNMLKKSGKFTDEFLHSASLNVWEK